MAEGLARSTLRGFSQSRASPRCPGPRPGPRAGFRSCVVTLRTASIRCGVLVSPALPSPSTSPHTTRERRSASFQWATCSASQRLSVSTPRSRALSAAHRLRVLHVLCAECSRLSARPWDLHLSLPPCAYHARRSLPLPSTHLSPFLSLPPIIVQHSILVLSIIFCPLNFCPIDYCSITCPTDDRPIDSCRTKGTTVAWIRCALLTTLRHSPCTSSRATRLRTRRPPSTSATCTSWGLGRSHAWVLRTRTSSARGARTRDRKSRPRMRESISLAPAVASIIFFLPTCVFHTPRPNDVDSPNVATLALQLAYVRMAHA